MAFEDATWTQDGTMQWSVVGGATATEVVAEGSAPGDVNMADYVRTDRGVKTLELEFTTNDIEAGQTIEEFRFLFMVSGAGSGGDEAGAEFALVVDGVEWATADVQLEYSPAEERMVTLNGFTKGAADWNGKTKKIKVVSDTASGKQPPDDPNPYED
jgi:hypothetical protein